MLAHSLLWSLVGCCAFAHAAPLTFQGALDRAVEQAPALAAQASRVAAARSSALAADALPDPKLVAGIDNLPVDGPDRFSTQADFMTMQRVGLMQDVPNAAKRQARAEVAEAGVARALAEADVLRQKLRRETAQAWIARYYVEQRDVLLSALERENAILADAMRAQLAGGRGASADIVLPKQEAAQLADRRDELARDLSKTKSELRRLIGAQADEPLAGEPPPLQLVAEELRAHVHEHPELASYAPALREAQAQVHEAQAAKRPDWGVQLAYQRRGPQFSNMVSLQVSFDLPLFASTRQDPQIAAKLHDTARIASEREAMLRDHRAELESDLAEYFALERQLQRAQETWLPLAQERLDLQWASYRAQKTDVATVIAARRDLVEQRLKVLELKGKRDSIAAKVRYSYGEGAP